VNAAPDAGLVASTLDGDEGAFALLVERHRTRIRSVAHAVLGDWAEAEDVTQEALLAAHATLARLRDPERFGAWLTAIAGNLAKMRLRSRRAGWTSLDELAGGLLSPSSEASEESELVREALDVLSGLQREAVLLHYVEGLSTTEIAALRGESPGAVRVRLHRARGRLRHELSVLGPTIGKETGMIEVELQDVIVRALAEDAASDLPRLANRQLRVVLLTEKAGERVLPIWIGAFEGDALALQLGGEATPRPLTPDLMARVVDALGGRIERVAITQLTDNTFYALVALAVDGRRSELDARPSDALNLAARVGAPIYVAGEVMEQAGRAGNLMPAELDRYEENFPSADQEGPGEWRSLTPELVKALWPAPPKPPEPPVDK
jgi:RNA polymerase sigma factor (sigma-70 family)